MESCTGIGSDPQLVKGMYKSMTGKLSHANNTGLSRQQRTLSFLLNL